MGKDTEVRPYFQIDKKQVIALIFPLVALRSAVILRNHRIRAREPPNVLLPDEEYVHSAQASRLRHI